MVKGELRSLPEIAREIHSFHERLRSQQRIELSEIERLATLEEYYDKQYKEIGEEKEERIIEKISAAREKIDSARSEIRNCLDQLKNILSELNTHHESARTYSEAASMMHEDGPRGDWNSTREKLSDGSERIQDEIIRLKRLIEGIQEESYREQEVYQEKILDRRSRARQSDQFVHTTGKIIRGIARVLRTTGRIVLRAAIIATTVAVTVAATAISILSRGVGIMGRQIGKGINQSGVFKRTGPAIGRINTGKPLRSNKFDPSPEAAIAFRSIFGPEEYSPVGGYAGNSHFGYVVPGPRAMNPGWHVTTEIPGMKQGRNIVVHDFVSDMKFESGPEKVGIKNRAPDPIKSSTRQSEGKAGGTIDDLVKDIEKDPGGSPGLGNVSTASRKDMTDEFWYNYYKSRRKNSISPTPVEYGRNYYRSFTSDYLSPPGRKNNYDNLGSDQWKSYYQDGGAFSQRYYYNDLEKKVKEWKY